MKTSSKFLSNTTTILSLSLVALATAACVTDPGQDDDLGAPENTAPGTAADPGAARVAAKPVPVRPATAPNVTLGDALPAKPAGSSKVPADVASLALTTTLGASPAVLWPTQFTTLTATASTDVGPTPFFLRIREVAGGAILASCGTGTTCAIGVTKPTDIQVSYVATIEDFSGGVQASATTSVLWTGTSLNLAVNATTLPLGATPTLTATTGRDIGPSPFFIEIFDATTGTLLRSCGTGTLCTVTVTQAAATTHAYQAFLAPGTATFPAPSAQRTTELHYVTWADSPFGVLLSSPVNAGASSQSVTATTNINVGPTPFFIEIFNQATGERLAVCATGTTCTATFPLTPTSVPLVAFISANSTTLPPATTQASSNIVFSFFIIG